MQKKKKIYRIYAKGKVKRVKTIITKNQLIIKEGRNKEKKEKEKGEKRRGKKERDKEWKKVVIHTKGSKYRMIELWWLQGDPTSPS